MGTFFYADGSQMKPKASQRSQTQVCRQCLLIRYFIATAVAVVLLALIAGENMKFLDMFTPERASVAIVLGGTLMAGVKIWLWRREVSENVAEAD